MIVTDEEFWVTACAALVGPMQAVKHGVSVSAENKKKCFFFFYIYEYGTRVRRTKGEDR